MVTYINNISKIIKSLNTDAEITMFFKELLTESELETLSKRWCILDMLSQGYTQRDISKKLNVSRASVTEALKKLANKGFINYGRYETTLH